VGGTKIKGWLTNHPSLWYYSRMVKAIKEPVPLSNGENIGQSAKAETTNSNLNGLCAEIRRLQARIKDMETQVSTLRRDVNRIDRGQYRAKAEPVLLPQSQEVDIWATLQGGYNG
jgi:hypothetical protein